uniref:G_PROTEIN_RECEP_F1_2 domain-containing protein n=1 Tax=Meloidogyne hapla TaxID=6305 RepID=A0A1I8BLD2_MELHA
MSFCYASIFSRLRRRNNTKLKKLNERQNMLARQSNNYENGLIVEEKVICLSRKTSSICEEKIGGKIRLNALNKQQRRTTTILATVVLFFGLAWLPQNVLTMIIEYDINLLNWGNTNYLYLFSLISHCLAMTTNVANPILYAWLNPTFKELFMKTKILKKRKENNLITSTKQLNTTSIRSSIQNNNNNNSPNEKRILVQLNFENN